MNEQFQLLAVSLAPVVVLFTYIYIRDKHDREPLRYLVTTFIYGIFTALPVVVLGDMLLELTGISRNFNENSTLELLIYAFAIVALCEEGMKYLVLRYYNYPHKEFDEPYDGIMYGAAVSLGFAAIENVLYVFDYGMSTGIVRMFTAVPAHATFGVLMGFYVGKAKFHAQSAAESSRMRMQGLLVAILFHGAYNFVLFLNWEWGLVFAVFTLSVGIMLARKAMRIHVAASPHKDL